MELKGYAKLKDLSVEKEGPEGSYISVKNKNKSKNGTFIKILFTTGLKNKKDHKIYLDSATSTKISDALLLFDRVNNWKIKIVEL